MSEVRVVEDRHYVVPLTDEEVLKVRVLAAKAGLKIKHWVSQAIREKSEREEPTNDR